MLLFSICFWKKYFSVLEYSLISSVHLIVPQSKWQVPTSTSKTPSKLSQLRPPSFRGNNCTTHQQGQWLGETWKTAATRNPAEQYLQQVIDQLEQIGTIAVQQSWFLSSCFLNVVILIHNLSPRNSPQQVNLNHMMCHCPQLT